MKLIIDLETDGLLQEVTKIHCMSIVNVNSSYSQLFTEDLQIKSMILKIANEHIELIGHNIFNYDLKVIEKLYGIDLNKFCKVHDTMLLAQLLFSDIKNEEDTHGLPGKLFSKRDTGSHSLRAWGQRIKCYKGEYSGTWESYNDDMGRYCIQDTYTTKALFQILESRVPDKLLSRHPIELEESIAPILARQQTYGVFFDKEKADKLVVSLTHALVESKHKLTEIFKPRYISGGEFVPKRSDKAKGYIKDRVFTKIIYEEFNPGSRMQIIDRLIKEYGWNPEEFTEKGNVKMDEDIIENLPFKELSSLKEYLTIKKRISQIETGKQAWINKVDNDGRIRGAIRQNGAVTGRMAHFGPNMAQVPSNDSLYGRECRELFTIPPGKIMIGCDADALEMRCLAGYLTPIDNGRFMKSLLQGRKEDGTDPHSINAEAMGVDRETAKTVFYANIYGAKNAKIGAILMESEIDFEEYCGSNFNKDVDGMIRWIKEKRIEEISKKISLILGDFSKLSDDKIYEITKANEEFKKKERSRKYWECWVAGKECLKRFGDRIPELPELNKKIKEKIRENGHIKGLDGRKLFCRSEHGALNTVLQSAGAIIMKKALAIADMDLQAPSSGLRPGIDYEFILNVHDEWQLEVLNEQKIVDKAKEIVQNSIKKSGEFFNFPCPMAGNVEEGNNWSETH